jgi:hypothetical protein
MNIDREDCDERQARLDWMIDEFRKAQSRRLAKANDKAVESQVKSDRKAVVTGSTTSQ